MRLTALLFCVSSGSFNAIWTTYTHCLYPGVQETSLSFGQRSNTSTRATTSRTFRQQISLLSPVVVDSTPLGVNFGDVKADVPPNSKFRQGQQVNDDDFILKFKWSSPAKLSPESQVTIEWRIPESAVAGVYRLRHLGASKSLFGSISSFSGASSAFVVR